MPTQAVRWRVGLIALLGATTAGVYLLWPGPKQTGISTSIAPTGPAPAPLPAQPPDMPADLSHDSRQPTTTSPQTPRSVPPRQPEPVEDSDPGLPLRPRMPWDHLEPEGPILMCPVPEGVPHGANSDLSAVVFDRNGEGRKFVVSVTYEGVFEAAAPPDATSGVLTYRGVAQYPFHWEPSRAQQVVRCVFGEPVPYLEASGTVQGTPYEDEWVHGCMDKAAIVEDEFWMAIAVTEPCEIFVVAVGERGNLYGPPLELSPGDLPSTNLVLRRP